ncbi:MAG: hypothetical protein QM831_25695 [Kofleriaceae bacterium]
MKRLAVALLVTQLSCVKHPALTAGIGGGAVALLSCEMQSGEQSTCGIVTGIVALALGGLAWGITTFTDTNAHQIPSDDEEMGSNGALRVNTHTDLPPGAILDAGLPPIVPDAAPVIDAAPIVDAP